MIEIINKATTLCSIIIARSVDQYKIMSLRPGLKIIIVKTSKAKQTK